MALEKTQSMGFDYRDVSMPVHVFHGRADHMVLAADVLIASDGCFADDAQVCAWNKSGAAHLFGHIVGEVHDLNVE